MSTRVLLLGATGAVGRACLAVLAADPRVAVTVAGRDPVRNRVLCASLPVRCCPEPLDLAAMADDGTRLATLAKSADVVVNCAGPSRRYSRPVAALAMLCGAAYVDPGLDRSSIQQIRRCLPGDGVAVVQAGVQPGLSGAALRLLAERLGGRPDRMSAWCGGSQPLTRAAVREYLEEVIAARPRGVSTVLRDGTRATVRPSEVPAAPGGFFPATARAHAHLDDEIEEVAAHVGATEVEWVNITDGAHTERAIGRLSARSDESPITDDSIDAVRAAAELDRFGREPYFTLLAQAQRNGAHASFVLRTRDSYAVTGAITAWAATAAGSAPPGVHPLWSLPHAVRLPRDLPRLTTDTEIRLTADGEEPFRTRPEEGVL